jgi:hypothetical protein
MKPKRYGENPERCMNQILAALPAPSRDWTQNLEPVKLAVGTVLYEPDETIEHVYFLTNALVSIISMNSDGATVEIGLIGYEGMAECRRFWGCRASATRFSARRVQSS